jgi:TatA/E family protein of Tat protein translocase
MPLLLLGSLGLPEILMIFFLVLILFGPKKLPEIGKALGKGIREFKRGTSGFMDSINDLGNESSVQPRPAPQPVKKAIESPGVPPETVPVVDVEEVEGIVVDFEGESGEKK